MVGGALTAVSGTVLGGLGAAFTSFVSQGDKLTDTANRIGITTTRLQELTYAAGQSGASMEDVERAMLTAQKKGLDFDKVAAKIAKIEDPMKRTQAAFAAFGKAGAKIAPMLKDLEEFSVKAHDLGLVLSPEDVALGGQMADMWGEITAQAGALTATVGAALAPAMNIVFENMSRVLAIAIRFVDENRGLVVAVAATAVGIGALGVALLGVAGIAAIASMAMTAYTMAAAAAAAVTAFLASPIGLAIVAVGALGAVILAAAGYWAFFTDSGKAAMAELGRILSGIFDAVAKGDFALAFQIAWQGVLVAFDSFASSLMTRWADMVGRMLNMLTDAKVTLGIETAGEGAAEKNARIAAEFRRRLEAEMKSAGAKAKLDALISEAARGAGGFPVKQPKMPSFGGAGGSSGQFGTFGGATAALAGISGTLSVQEKQLKALEGIEEGIDEVVKLANEGGLVFA